MHTHTQALIIGVVIILLLIGGNILMGMKKPPIEAPLSEEHESTPTPSKTPSWPIITTIGHSVQNRPIESYTYGEGTSTVLLVGGIHGGYEWNSVLLAYTFIDHLATHPELIPKNLTVTIIPSLNPDGLFTVVGKEGRFMLSDIDATKDASPGRFNGHGIDLNRNFDCTWKPTSTWKGKTVSAGTAPFSEPEAAALREVIENIKPVGVVFWHSEGGAVYASECEKGVLEGTRILMNTYAQGAAYPAVESFDAYPVTGDAEGWLAKIGIPAITVELSTHETLEWEKNLAGFTAIVDSYSAAK